MAKLILCVYIVSLICATLAQDFEPPLLEGPKTTTLEPPAATTLEPSTTTIRLEPSTTTTTLEPPTTTTETSAKTTDAPTIETPSTTTIATTAIPTTEPVTDSPFPTTQKTTTTPRTTTSSTTSSNPWYLNKPCYYKSQQGFPQVTWKCGRFQYVTPIECFRCCLYANTYFAGCYRVHDYYCQTNNIRNDNDNLNDFNVFAYLK